VIRIVHWIPVERIAARNVLIDEGKNRSGQLDALIRKSRLDSAFLTAGCLVPLDLARAQIRARRRIECRARRRKEQQSARPELMIDAKMIREFARRV
jgi:hypothetical protein